VSEPQLLDLARSRRIGELLGDAIRIYARNFPVVFAIAAAIVAPVQLVVSGIGLEELTSSYHENATTAEAVIPTLVSFLVVAPLIAATTIHVLQELAAGNRPRPGRTLQAGLDLFAPVFAAVVLAGAAIAVGLVVFVIPGIYVAVHLLFVPQAVVIDGARNDDALRQSWGLTKGFWWRTFFVGLIANVIAFLPGLLIFAPLESLAHDVDRQWISLAGMILTETLTAPFVAIVSTLLFFDLKARRPDGQLQLPT
jgi:hypothetical protein